MQLPPPVEQAPAPAALPEAGVATAEQAPARPETAPTTGAAPAVSAPPIMLPTTPPAAMPAQKSDDSKATLNVASITADDGDLIEKEWVNKAKAIVERTREDPYKQSEELTEVKAEYLQKRYNKSLKLNK